MRFIIYTFQILRRGQFLTSYNHYTKNKDKSKVVKTLLESSTYTNLFEEALGFLERAFEFQRLFRCAILDFIHVIPCIPENQTIAEPIVSGFDKVILLNHRIIIAKLGAKVKRKNFNGIKHLGRALEPPLKRSERSFLDPLYEGPRVEKTAWIGSGASI